MDEIAWLVVVPCAAALIFVVVAVGPPFGRLIAPHHPPVFWSYSQFTPRAEPTEHARYLLTLLGPVLLAGVIVAAISRRAWRVSVVTAVLGHLTQALLVAFLAACLVIQRTITYDATYGGPPHRAFFTTSTLAVSAALALVIAVAIWRGVDRGRTATWVRETPRRRVVCFGLAGLVTLTWLLTAINLERSLGGVHPGVAVALPWWLDETYAVLDGRTPLVDFTSPYSHLWPYLAAAAMSLLGTSVGVYTTAMAAGSAAALVAMYATFRRVVGSSIAALAVYLPFLATGFFMELGPLANRYGPSTLLSMFPMRYAGPYLLAWLTVRHLDGARPRRLELVFLLGGIVVINNPEFGVAALGATLVASGLAQTDFTPSTVRRVLGRAALGMAGAVALVSLLTLVRAGSLPDFTTLTIYPRLYAVDGYGMLPMHTVGLHLAIYVTFVAAIVVATVRAVGRHERDALTAMLAWSGVFGLGAGGYFAGRSHPEVLIDLFSAWALALVLLTIVAVRAIAARASRRPLLAELAVIAGFGLAVCSLAQTPTPWSQVERLRHSFPSPDYQHAAFERFVARWTKAGEHVAIVAVPSHWIAYDVGVDNVAPYIGFDWMPAKQQLGETVDALRRANGRKLFVTGQPDAASEFDRYLAQRGLKPAAVGDGAVEWVDRRPRR